MSTTTVIAFWIVAGWLAIFAVRIIKLERRFKSHVDEVGAAFREIQKS